MSAQQFVEMIARMTKPTFDAEDDDIEDAVVTMGNLIDEAQRIVTRGLIDGN
jgi:hypothetical protein